MEIPAYSIPVCPRKKSKEANVLASDSNIAKTLRVLRKQKLALLVKRRPDEFQAQGELGVLLTADGQYDVAVQLLEHVLHENNSSVHLWSTLGLAQYMLGSFAKAYFSLQKAVSLALAQGEQAASDCYARLVRAAILTGDFEAALYQAEGYLENVRPSYYSLSKNNQQTSSGKAKKRSKQNVSSSVYGDVADLHMICVSVLLSTFEAMRALNHLERIFDLIRKGKCVQYSHENLWVLVSRAYSVMGRATLSRKALDIACCQRDPVIIWQDLADLLLSQENYLGALLAADQGLIVCPISGFLLKIKQQCLEALQQARLSEFSEELVETRALLKNVTELEGLPDSARSSLSKRANFGTATVYYIRAEFELNVKSSGLGANDHESRIGSAKSHSDADTDNEDNRSENGESESNEATSITNDQNHSSTSLLNSTMPESEATMSFLDIPKKSFSRRMTRSEQQRSVLRLYSSRKSVAPIQNDIGDQASIYDNLDRSARLQRARSQRRAMKRLSTVKTNSLSDVQQQQQQQPFQRMSWTNTLTGRSSLHEIRATISRTSNAPFVKQPLVHQQSWPRKLGETDSTSDGSHAHLHTHHNSIGANESQLSMLLTNNEPSLRHQTTSLTADTSISSVHFNNTDRHLLSPGNPNDFVTGAPMPGLPFPKSTVEVDHTILEEEISEPSSEEISDHALPKNSNFTPKDLLENKSVSLNSESSSIGNSNLSNDVELKSASAIESANVNTDGLKVNEERESHSEEGGEGEQGFDALLSSSRGSSQGSMIAPLDFSRLVLNSPPPNIEVSPGELYSGDVSPYADDFASTEELPKLLDHGKASTSLGEAQALSDVESAADEVAFGRSTDGQTHVKKPASSVSMESSKDSEIIEELSDPSSDHSVDQQIEDETSETTSISSGSGDASPQMRDKGSVDEIIDRNRLTQDVDTIPIGDPNARISSNQNSTFDYVGSPNVSTAHTENIKLNGSEHSSVIPKVVSSMGLSPIAENRHHNVKNNLEPEDALPGTKSHLQGAAESKQKYDSLYRKSDPIESVRALMEFINAEDDLERESKQSILTNYTQRPRSPEVQNSQALATFNSSSSRVVGIQASSKSVTPMDSSGLVAKGRDTMQHNTDTSNEKGSDVLIKTEVSSVGSHGLLNLTHEEVEKKPQNTVEAAEALLNLLANDSMSDESLDELSSTDST